ncbi:MAG: glycosyltransferase family 2 protein [bacterium]|nr:glycosyltransferase family 2 protein [bacterium]
MISVLIISKNDGDVISNCIKSVKNLADEVIVVDDSDDETGRIAESLGARVVKNKSQDFASQRNFAASLARNKWIFYIDCDERVTPEFIKEVKETMRAFDSEEIGGFFIKRKTFYFGRDWGFEDRVQRIFLKEKFKEWKGIVHETPLIDGTFGDIKEPILHRTHRNLEHMVDKTNEWSEFEADLRIKAHHPKMRAWRFFRVMVTAFIKSYFGAKGYKNGTAGLIEAIYQSFSMFITYAKLWEKQHSRE